MLEIDSSALIRDCVIEASALCEGSTIEFVTNDTDNWLVSDATLCFDIGAGVRWNVGVCSLVESLEIVAVTPLPIDESCIASGFNEADKADRFDEVCGCGVRRMAEVELDSCCSYVEMYVVCELTITTDVENSSLRVDTSGAAVSEGNPSELENKLRVCVTTPEETLLLSEAGFVCCGSAVGLRPRRTIEVPSIVVAVMKGFVSFRRGCSCRLDMGNAIPSTTCLRVRRFSPATSD